MLCEQRDEHSLRVEGGPKALYRMITRRIECHGNLKLNFTAQRRKFSLSGNAIRRFLPASFWEHLRRIDARRSNTFRCVGVEDVTRLCLRRLRRAEPVASTREAYCEFG